MEGALRLGSSHSALDHRDCQAGSDTRSGLLLGLGRSSGPYHEGDHEGPAKSRRDAGSLAGPDLARGPGPCPVQALGGFTKLAARPAGQWLKPRRRRRPGQGSGNLKLRRTWPDAPPPSRKCAGGRLRTLGAGCEPGPGRCPLAALGAAACQCRCSLGGKCQWPLRQCSGLGSPAAASLSLPVARSGWQAQ